MIFLVRYSYKEADTSYGFFTGNGAALGQHVGEMFDDSGDVTGIDARVVDEESGPVDDAAMRLWVELYG
jgi:hypothetical protein